MTQKIHRAADVAGPAGRYTLCGLLLESDHARMMREGATSPPGAIPPEVTLGLVPTCGGCIEAHNASYNGQLAASGHDPRYSCAICAGELVYVRVEEISIPIDPFDGEVRWSSETSREMNEVMQPYLLCVADESHVFKFPGITDVQTRRGGERLDTRTERPVVAKPPEPQCADCGERVESVSGDGDGVWRVMG